MGHIIECKKAGNKNKNTGAKEQCTAAPVIRHALATNEQVFDTVADFKDLAVWKTQRDDKKNNSSFSIRRISNC